MSTTREESSRRVSKLSTRVQTVHKTKLGRSTLGRPLTLRLEKRLPPALASVSTGFDHDGPATAVCTEV